MIEQSKGKIYLSTERGHTESEWFRSYNTFNFGSYQNENRKPFGPLYLCNEDTIAPGKSFSLLVEQDSDVIIVPTVGVISLKENTSSEIYIQAGEIFIHSAVAGTTLHFGNPLEKDLVNFLQLWLTNASAINSFKTSFNLNNNRNKLIELHTDEVFHTKFSIAKLTGRNELEYILSKPANGVFVFVIEGAFEVQYRLLEARDSLALWNVEKLEIEALSNDAIIIMLEVNGSLDFTNSFH